MSSRQNAAPAMTMVNDNFRLYTYTNHGAKHSDTITVLIQGGKALFIETAYPEYAERTKKELAAEGVTPAIVVLSHYHPDHAGGCSALTGCDIYASEFYEPNYNNCHIWEPGLTYIKANKLIKGGDTLTFGDFQLKFHHTPGHSKCSLVTEISRGILHLGDLMMINWERKNSLPYIADGGSFQEHIAGLEWVLRMDPEAVVLPHGGLIDNKVRIKSMVEDRLYYLRKVMESNGALPLEQCLKKAPSWYDCLNFHDTNIMQLT